MRQYFYSFVVFSPSFVGKRRGSVNAFVYCTSNNNIISLENQSLKFTKSVKYFKNRTMDELVTRFKHFKDIAFGK